MSEVVVDVQRFVRETDDDLIVLISGREVSLPLDHISQIRRSSGKGWIKIAEWLAEKENLL